MREGRVGGDNWGMERAQECKSKLLQKALLRAHGATYMQNVEGLFGVKAVAILFTNLIMSCQLHLCKKKHFSMCVLLVPMIFCT